MRKLAIALAAAFLSVSAAGVSHAQQISNYASDRAEIESLNARYLFAYDWHDIDAYLETFAPDGILDYGGGVLQGREAIRAYLVERKASRDRLFAATPSSQRPPLGRHFITNLVLDIDGHSARAVSYWTHMTTNRTGFGTVDFFGHYEDELVKIDGEWLYARRNVFNEAVAAWAAKANNPVKEATPHPSTQVTGPARAVGGTD